MAITAALTITQGTDASKITLTDATDYTSEPIGGMTSRTVVITKSDGTTLGTYTFSGTDLTKEVTDLTKDLSIKAVFTIVPAVVVGGSTYTDTVYQSITGYSMQNFYARHKKLSLNQRLENNKDYTNDTFRILMEVDAAVNSATVEDIAGAQLCLDRAAKIISNNKIPY